jgi:ribosomal protein L32
VTHFIVCRTCGKYLAAGDVVARGYCSEECTYLYSSCVNCGRYFLHGKGFDSEHCSKDCTIRYQILRKYGPEPVTVVAEV